MSTAHVPGQRVDEELLALLAVICFLFFAGWATSGVARALGDYLAFLGTGAALPWAIGLLLLAGAVSWLRLWAGCLVGCTAGAAAVSGSAPALSVVPGVPAFAALQRAPRARRSVDVLAQLATRSLTARESTA